MGSFPHARVRTSVKVYLTHARASPTPDHICPSGQLRSAPRRPRCICSGSFFISRLALPFFAVGTCINCCQGWRKGKDSLRTDPD
ncbi:hypothetical protein FIBSPDRAFT_36238 [Athelia psychrophila]|uniref:Uncharacterized protein n=1 Tax=Athelia psychrophila TaxID=1759441 RepID=A0A166FTJ3_9AGAM|nr:hypothetical protein FIBSPDRAFT_36238 [Fibularhizoctonia sp. CBS 109695]